MSESRLLEDPRLDICMPSMHMRDPSNGCLQSSHLFLAWICLHVKIMNVQYMRLVCLAHAASVAA